MKMNEYIEMLCVLMLLNLIVLRYFNRNWVILMILLIGIPVFAIIAIANTEFEFFIIILMLISITLNIMKIFYIKQELNE